MEYTRLAVLIWCLHIGPTVGAGDVQLGCDVKETRRKSHECCFSRGKRLPGITSDRELQILMTEMERNRYLSVWLDLKRKRLSTWHWVDGSPMEIKPGHSRGHCAYIDILTTVVSHTLCSDQSRGYVCQVKDCSSCHTLTHDSHYCEQHSGACFLFYCNKMNWPNARNKCQKRGYDLAITNRTVFSPDKQFYQECRSLWVGGYKDIWTAQHDSETTVGLWGDQQPSSQGNCSVLKQQGGEFLIQSEYCSNRHFSLCYGTHIETINQSANYGLYSSESPTVSTTQSQQTLFIIIGVVIGVCFICTGTGLCIYKRYGKKRTNTEDSKQQESGNTSASERLMGESEANQGHRKRIDDSIDTPSKVDESSSSNVPPRSTCSSDDFLVSSSSRKSDNIGKEVHEVKWKTGESSVFKRTLSDKSGPHCIPGDDIPKMVANSIRRKYAKVEINILESEVIPKDIEDIFTPLLLYDSEKGKLDNYTQILDVKYLPTRICLLGELGHGKTTVIKQILNDWIDAVLSDNQRKIHFALVIPIFLRRVKAKTLNEVLEDQLSLNKDEVTRVINYVEHHQLETLYLFDGFDEFDSDICGDIDDIVKGKSSTKPNVLVTARGRSCFSFDNTSENPDFTIELRGFSRESSRQFMLRYLKEKNDAEKCMKSIEESNLTELSQSPFLLSLMCVIWKNERALAGNITNFYRDVIEFVCIHHQRKHIKCKKRKRKAEILNKYKEEILDLGKFAIDILKAEKLKLSFPADTVLNVCKEPFKLGLLGRDADISETGRMTFLHKHIFEFIAAFYIASLDKSEKDACLKSLKQGALQELDYFVKFLKDLDSDETANQIKYLIAGTSVS